MNAISTRIVSGIAAFVAILGGTSESSAQLLLGAPGVGLSYRQETEVPFSHNSDLGRYYKFIFAGAEAQADTDGVPGTYAYDGFMWNKKKKNNNGHGNNVDGVDSGNPGKSKLDQDTDPDVDDEKKDNGSTGSDSGETSNSSSAEKINGWWKFLAGVNGFEITGMEYSSPALHQLSDVMRIYFDAPIVIREQNITLTWSGNGNSKDPDGHLYILGSAIKEPPVPWGKLNLGQTLYTAGSKPVFEWNIVRE